MEYFKLTSFIKQYGFEIPTLQHLTLEECEIIRSKLYPIFITDNIDFVLNEINNSNHTIKSFDYEEENFSFKDLFTELDIIIPKEIFINWYKFDDIDTISFEAFNKYFFDIWYPIADDIEIFDKDLKWLVSIRHYGVASLVFKF